MSCPFALSEVLIRDYRCFGELHWAGVNPAEAGVGEGEGESVSSLSSEAERTSNLNVLVGPNMSGKSALLQAIAIALNPHVRHFVNSMGPRIRDEDVRRISDPHQLSRRVSGPVEIEARFKVGDRSVTSRVTRDASVNARTRWAETRDVVRVAGELSDAHAAGEPLPIVAMYGTQRLWLGVSRTRRRMGNEWSDGYLDCLDPRSTYEVVRKWANVTTRSLGRKSSGGRPERSLGLLHDLVRIVLHPVGITDVDYVLDEDDFFAEVTQAMLADVSTWSDIWSDRWEQMWLPVSSLSDGVRTMVGLVGDIARRISLLNAGLPGVDLRETPGIIMIDEVDLHLHPVWQQQVLATLCEALPNVQWIVTTHSPQVVSTAPRTSVWVLDAQRDEEGRKRADAWVMTHPQQQTEGVDSGDVLAQVFQVDPMPDTFWRRLLAEVEQELEGDPKADVESKMNELRRHFGDGHIPLQLLELARDAS